MKKKYFLDTISSINLNINKPCIIFLIWDLWYGKTTLSKYILNEIVWIKDSITSPTYTYYNKYGDNYHFDLYRLKNYDEFFAIWAEEILDNNNWVIVIEWPEIIKDYYRPDIIINISKTDIDNEREIEIIYP
jgi:tRNA threonylcarbamoyladenosine biosynthesis protein TsaE